VDRKRPPKDGRGENSDDQPANCPTNHATAGFHSAVPKKLQGKSYTGRRGKTTTNRIRAFKYIRLHIVERSRGKSTSHRSDGILPSSVAGKKSFRGTLASQTQPWVHSLNTKRTILSARLERVDGGDG
jgi:hypothetical protein